MDSDQRRGRVDIAHDQSDGFFDSASSIRAGLQAKTMNTEVAPACGELGGSDLLN